MQKSREIVSSPPAGICFLRVCHALQSARIAPRPRPQSPDGNPVSTSIGFCGKVLVRRDVRKQTKKITIITIHVQYANVVV